MPMIRHHDEPGSQAWLQRRLGSFNASDAPAMLGCSTNKTRSALLHELYTSIRPEFSDYVQARVIDRGHRIEEFMRPIAAGILDEDDLEVIGGSLPVEGLSRPLGASLDGRAMLGRAIWECKSINEELRANLPHEGRDSAEKNDGRQLHKMYRVQMEQQLMVDERAERTLFTAAAVDGNGNVTEERHCWYESDPALRAEILAGWKQFDADLAEFTPLPAEPPAPIGRAPASLPELFFSISGEVTESNVDEFKEVALTAIRSVNRDLKTDQDFADSAKARKWCEEVETRVETAKNRALSKTVSIKTLLDTLDEIGAEARSVRLELQKLEKSRTNAINTELVMAATKDFADHIEKLNAAMPAPYMPKILADFGGAISGLRSVSSKQNAIGVEMARAKIESTDAANRIQANLRTLAAAADFAFLFNDTAAIVLKAPDDLTVLVKSRIAEHKAKEEAKLEAERERIRKEEQERADREAREKLAQQEREAEAKRQEEERARRETLLQNEKAAQADIEQAVQKGELAAPLAQDIRAIQDDLTAAPVSREAISNAQRTAAAAPAAPEGPPTLRIGHIADRLGWSMTAEQMRALGIEPAAKERGSVLYHESQFPALCDAIARRALEAKAAHSQHATA